jgi:hypothetical protein
MAMSHITVSIDPQFSDTLRTDVYAAMRLMLTTAGFAWREVSADTMTTIDLALATDLRLASRARVLVVAELAKWAQPAAWRIERLRESGEWIVPCYAGDTDGPIMEATNGCLIIHRDVLFDIFWQSTGRDEAQAKHNKHGHTIWDAQRVADHALRRTPVASSLIQQMTQALSDATGIAPAPKWPDGKRAALGLSHDVDYPEVVRWLEPARIVRRLSLRGVGAARDVLIGRRTHWHFQSWIELERKYGMSSAFYFVARQGSLLEYATGTPDSFYDVRSSRFRELFRKIDGQGWEVGMHASYNAYRSAVVFGAEKRLLERAAGVTVAGCRHHYWHVNPTDPEETLGMHQLVGLEYDTSLAYDRYVGWRRGLCTPYQPYDAKRRIQLDIVQLPPCWMDDQLFSYRALNPGDRGQVLTELVASTVRCEGCLVTDVHDYVFDDALFPAWGATYAWLLAHVAERGDFWYALPRDIARHWRERSQRIAQSSSGL